MSQCEGPGSSPSMTDRSGQGREGKGRERIKRRETTEGLKVMTQ